MTISLILVLLLVPLIGTAFADSQILSTDVGTLDVKVFPLDYSSTGGTNLNVDFINPSTDKFFQHIDYTILITKDGQFVFEREGHTAKGTVLIPADFPESGIYNIDITIQGIFFQEIPTEKVSFKVPVILKEVVPSYIVAICHNDITVEVYNADIRGHIQHGDTRGECKTISKPIIEEINIPTPETEITETLIQEVPVPQVTISSEPEKILTPQETTNFIDLIISTMNFLFALVYELEDDPRLEQWASDVIQDRVERTQEKIYAQLETTQDTSQLRAESNKILNPTPQPQIIQPIVQPTVQPQIIQPTIVEHEITPSVTTIPTTPAPVTIPVSQSIFRDIIIEYEPIPETADEAIVNRAIGIATSEWSKKNPDLRIVLFPQREPDLIIQWREVEFENELGHAELGTLNYPGVGYMEISLGNYDCNGDYVLQDQYMVADTIMHEIGHAFGLEHNSDENHLMYGDDQFTQQNFDTLGLKIPRKLSTDNYVEQDKLNTELDSLNKKIDENNKKIEKLNEDIENSVTRIQNEPDPNMQKRQQFRLDIMIEENNTLYDETTLLINKANEILPKVNCFPNVE